ncbi:MAG: hypothetical protein GX456_00375 [Verrucomicrobia bacterium]|nr:hypothetical protein [Verrucomicrobiota bacterium]
MQLSTVQQLPFDRLASLQSNGRRQGQGKIDIETRSLGLGTNNLHVYAIALGYEDHNDHQRLRLNSLLPSACNKTDPLGQYRFNPDHRGVALASASTLNRLELSNNSFSFVSSG